MDEYAIRELIREVKAGRLSRRSFIRAMVGVGLTAPLASQMLAANGIAQTQTKPAAGFTPTKLSTEAAVTLERDAKGFKKSRSELSLRAEVPGLDEAQFEKLSGEAERDCPVSKLLNATIALDAKLV